jgi:hypothetical protein
MRVDEFGQFVNCSSGYICLQYEDGHKTHYPSGWICAYFNKHFKWPTTNRVYWPITAWALAASLHLGNIATFNNPKTFCEHQIIFLIRAPVKGRKTWRFNLFASIAVYALFQLPPCSITHLSTPNHKNILTFHIAQANIVQILRCLKMVTFPREKG